MRTIKIKAKDVIKRKGRRPGEHHYIKMNMPNFLREYNLTFLADENPYITKIGLIENPLMRESYAAANFKKNRVELSSTLLNDTVEHQKIGFIKALCSFIALREFGLASGIECDKLIQRYLNNVTTKKEEAPKTTVRVSSV